MGNPIRLQLVLFCALFCTLFLSKFSTADDIISSTQFIRDGETLVSAKEEFELGFFSPGSSTKRYLGIWYKKIDIRTIVWVANRNNPISNSTGILQFANEGNLILVNGLAGTMWSSNTSKVTNPVAQLLDTGNFVIREQGNVNPAKYLWQSFDYPTDTLLPGMKLGWNLKTGFERCLTSWRTVDDPAIGDYIHRIDLHGLPQSYIFNGTVPKFRSGFWNGLQFSGIPIKHSYIFNFSYVTNQDEQYYAFYLKEHSTYSRLVMNYTGKIERYIWLERGKGWNQFWAFPSDNCDNYAHCGAYGVCDQEKDNTEDPLCNCIKGYRPKYSQDWSFRYWSGGCVRKTKSECQENDGFFTMSNMKLPDTSRSYVIESISIEECRVECLNNCSCKAYATHDITNGGRGCIIWTDDLKDVRVMVLGGQDLYVRLPASELDSIVSTKTESTHKRKKPVKLIVTLTAISATLLLGLSICFIWKNKMKQSMQSNSLERRDSQWEATIQTRDYPGEKKDDLELVLFDMDTIVKATSNFSSVNMLGQGGFGCVYKGTLKDGQEIAVKRLSATSGQGGIEFQNEVVLIAKLQHRNLVRLLGSCIDGDEKMLIYEYMKNKGLDSILFNKTYNSLLDWPERFKIIMGISRGLLYLHQDSRFRIVHRDLKASNILLDGDMNPKISDFGMARIFGGDDTEGKTKRVVGTYGYMSPEYAMDGLFSVKSDVFSFGVLVLEVISGKKNNGFFCSDDQLNLLRHAWNLWREGRALELIEESLRNSCRPQEALRCIQVSLLCVQERAEDRPTMSSVVLMFSSDSTTFPEPRQPGFSYVRNPNETESSSSKKDSINKMTVTLLEPRAITLRVTRYKQYR